MTEKERRRFEQLQEELLGLGWDDEPVVYPSFSEYAADYKKETGREVLTDWWPHGSGRLDEYDERKLTEDISDAVIGTRASTAF